MSCSETTRALAAWRGLGVADLLDRGFALAAGTLLGAMVRVLQPLKAPAQTRQAC